MKPMYTKIVLARRARGQFWIRAFPELSYSITPMLQLMLMLQLINIWLHGTVDRVLRCTHEDVGSNPTPAISSVTTSLY